MLRKPIKLTSEHGVDVRENIEELLQEVVNNDFEGKVQDDVLSTVERAFLLQFPSIYCLKYKPIRRKPMTFKSKYSPFKHRPWQVKILDDKHHNKACEKSRQLGLSEIAMSEFIWFLDVHKETKGMYTFPRDAQMRDFSATRITPSMKDSPYLSQLLSSSVSNMSLKKIGSSYLFMRSAWGSALGEGVDLDIAGFDEYDRMKDNVELAFMEGLKSSKYGWVRRWSTPTIPGRGINEVYQKSNQQRYFWRCEHCGERQCLDFKDNLLQIKPKGVNRVTQEIEDGTFIIGCKKCKKEMNRWAEGEWVAAKPGIKDISGYHISQMDAVWITADSIMRRQFDYPSTQLFVNYVLGEAYTSVGLTIVDEDIKEAIRLPGEVMSRNRDYGMISVGIDWGGMNWMIIYGNKSNSREKDILAIYWYPDNAHRPLEAVRYFTAILKAYSPDIIVADAGYGADRNAELYTHFPEAFYSCYWETIKDSSKRVKFLDKWNDKTHEVTVDKTSKIQKMLYALKGREIGMFPWSEKVEMFTKHVKNVRVMDEEDEGVLYQVATRIGPDHLGCCLAYAMIGMDRLTEMGIRTGSFSYDFI